MAVKLEIKIIECEDVKPQTFCASMENTHEIIAGYGKDPYIALRDLIDEIEYQHQYFRADNE